MIDAGISRRLHRRPVAAVADNGDIVVAGIPGEEATVKTFCAAQQDLLRPSNPTMEDLVFDPSEVQNLRQARHVYAADVTSVLDSGDPEERFEQRQARVKTDALDRARPRCAPARDRRAEVARRDPVSRKAGDVGPAELRRTGRSYTPVISAMSGCMRLGGRRHRRVQHVDMVGARPAAEPIISSTASSSDREGA